MLCCTLHQYSLGSFLLFTVQVLILYFLNKLFLLTEKMFSLIIFASKVLPVNEFVLALIDVIFSHTSDTKNELVYVLNECAIVQYFLAINLSYRAQTKVS